MQYLTEIPNEIYYLTYPGPNMHLQKLRRSSGIDLNMTEKASHIFLIVYVQYLWLKHLQ